jgi:hypothetical protein
MNPTKAEDVRMWRPRDHPRLLMMHGTTSSYAVEPDGAYIVGLILRGGLRARRGGERHVLRPGDLCVWDPSRAHSGSPYGATAWEARLMVVELADLDAILADADGASTDLEVRDPLIADPLLARRFLAAAARSPIRSAIAGACPSTCATCRPTSWPARRPRRSARRRPRA